VRIVIYGINYKPELTGIGKYSGEMAEWLVSKGHEVRIVTAPPYYPHWQVLKGFSKLSYRRGLLDGVDVWRCPLWIPKKLSGLKRILHLASFAFSSFPVMLIQLFWRPNIILVVEPPLFCAPTTLFISRLCKARSWLHVQDFEVDAAFDLGVLSSPLLHRSVTGLERWLMRKFDKVSTISEQMMRLLSAKNVNSERQVLFPNWVDIDQIYPMVSQNVFRKQLNISEQTIVFLYSVNMGEKQGLEIIIEAAHLLVAESNIRFIMCGEGAAYSRLREKAKGVSNINWLPLQPLEKLNDLLNMADVHLLPQRRDVADLVMPSKLTGMMASGKPVVATVEIDSQISTVLQGAGVIVPPGDINSFVKEIKNLAKDKEYREHLGTNARDFAVEHLGRGAILSKFERELQKLLID
jgi:colanic acid biosynthesis glycosyl transferase WcaI